MVGLDQTQESEGNVRYSLLLPGVQGELIAAVAAAASGPVVVVFMNGGAVDASNVTADPNVDAILGVGYPGQSGGQGLADVLFGTYNPAGRLTQTWYHADYVNQISMFSMGMRPNVTDNSPGRGYRFFTGDTVFQFGQGLSYTTFLYSWIEATHIPRETIIADTQTYGIYPSRAPVRGVASVLVTNNGTMAGDVSVLLFIEPMSPGQG